MKHGTIITTVVLGLLGVLAIDQRETCAEESQAANTLLVPEGAGMTPVARQAKSLQGGLLAVDVYLSNIEDLGAYQIGLEATGGTRGDLSVERVDIDRARADYVFGEDETVDMLTDNPLSARIGVVSATGGVALEAHPVYAGTFYFRASQDASGTFFINVQKGPAYSLMTTSQARDLPFTAGDPATITIRMPKRTRSSRID